ncbi:Zinc finger Y-chromosomal protein [Clonorchis sinensis]|uniref:Zinc finger Y-chromosomal protein n=1 Tax=Clonorchis sinensis TaxID=79923 RepID=A0A3R7D4P6_CLOSI|nr:Zinc finger Y-chromosomal protein [Clonorchis sinensis]
METKLLESTRNRNHPGQVAVLQIAPSDLVFKLVKTSDRVAECKSNAMNTLLHIYAPTDANQYGNLGDTGFGFTSPPSTHQSFAQARSSQSPESSNGPHRCPICSKAFQYSCYLNYHLERHSNRKPYKCDFCPSYFKSLGNQENHMIERHREEMIASRDAGTAGYTRLLKRKCYFCPDCGRRFCSRSVFNMHTVVHTDDRQHACQVCGYRFKTLRNMRRHVAQCRLKAIKDTATSANAPYQTTR